MVCKYLTLWDDLDPIHVTDYDIYIYICGYVCVYIYIYVGNGIMSNTVFRCYKCYISAKGLSIRFLYHCYGNICFLRHVCMMCYLKPYDGIARIWGANVWLWEMMNCNVHEEWWKCKAC